MDKPSRMRYIPIFDSWKDKNGYKLQIMLKRNASSATAELLFHF